MLLISGSLSAQQPKPEDYAVEVVSSKWSKYRQKINKSDNQATTPRVLPLSNRANRNFERNRRVNDPVGTPDPNAETIEGRSEALEKNVQESRNPKSVFVDGFLYQAKLRNTGKSTIEILFWEYRFSDRANPANASSRQFLCGVKLKPGKEQDLNIFSTFSPGGVISAEGLEDKNGELYDEKIVINRVEYSDGVIWQRKDWSYKEIKSSIERALSTPWGTEMCRNL